MATIKDIAALAGVSVGTVSKVINGDKNVSFERTQKVHNAIETLGYVPNSIARALKTRISHTIGLVLPDINNPFYAELARGVEDSLGQRGYVLFLCNKDRSREKEETYMNTLIQKNVDGIILVKPTIAVERLNHISKQLPLSLIDFKPVDNAAYSCLNVGDEAAARGMMEYLYRMGHRRIAYFMGNVDAFSDEQRYQGYTWFMKEKGLFDDTLIHHCNRYSIENGYHATCEMLASQPLPQAIFAANDILAIGIIRALHDKRLRVPQDISVVGCDDITLSSFIHPGLTTINRPKYEMGKRCAEMLIEMISTQSHTAIQADLEAPLVMRQSVRQAR